MIRKKVLNPERIRQIHGGFSFIPHRFLTGGFLESLSATQLLLYIFLVLAADRHGLSYYSGEQYESARAALIDKELIAFDGTLFQVLELPETPCNGQKRFG